MEFEVCGYAALNHVKWTVEFVLRKKLLQLKKWMDLQACVVENSLKNDGKTLQIIEAI